MKKIEEMTDLELQQAQLENSRVQIRQLKSINSKLTFFVILTVISLILGLIIAMAGLGSL
jgi:hypothetical protein